MYHAYITTLKNVRPHPNAERLQLAECFGNTICVDLSYVEGQKVAYFPTDGQLSVEFCEHNNLLRKKDGTGGYMDPDKRNVTAIRLRGEKSDGLALPLSCLDYTGVKAEELEVGMAFTCINGYEICTKYIPRTNRSNRTNNKEGNRTRKKKVPIAPLFAEHADTEQLAYNLAAFNAGDEIEITLKMHGTSQRTAYLPVLKGYKRTLMDRLFRREGTPIYEYGYVSGTRRTILENFEGGFYGSNEFRETHSKKFEGRLWEGESVYYEIVGFTHMGSPIMGDGSNERVGKDFVKQYGKTTTFSYGCSSDGRGEPISYWDNEKTIPCMVPIMPQSDMYVYRMTYTTPEGNVIEYTPDFMRYRCEQMGIKCVPLFERFIIPDDVDAGEYVKEKAEQYYDGPDPIGKTHVREGVVVRIVNKPKFCAFKHKNFSFKALEGIIKASSDAPDMEEAQEVTE